MVQIKASTIEFLKKLQRNNNREWFAANKSTYYEAKENFEEFITAALAGIVKFDPVLKGLEANSCIFRINRDIRFSNDKSPYKTNFGAFIVRGGRKNGDKYAGYYLHVEPGSPMIAGGAYMPPREWLAAIREKIVAEPDEFLSILTEKKFKKFFGGLEGEKLKSAPKGFEKDHKMIEYLKHKDYLAINNLTDKQVLDPGFLNYYIESAQAMKPFNDFLTVL
ncbi:MAG: DUF2461 domain-containing protein [Bacteroidales bacterium]